MDHSITVVGGESLNNVFLSIGTLVLIVGFLLVIYFATKASGRTIGIALGTIVLSIVTYGLLQDAHRGHVVPGVDIPVDAMAAVGPTNFPKTTNQQLWNQITRARIELGEEEKRVTKIAAAIEEPKEQKSEVEDANSETTEEIEEATKPLRPDWVENPPKRMGNIYKRVISSDPFSTVEECQKQLEGLLQNEVQERLQALASEKGKQNSILVPPTESFGIGLSYIIREICQDEYTETIEASFGEMKRVWVLMQFSPAVENHLLESWQQHQRRYRLSVVGKFAALTLTLLASVYGLLQFDTWTRGYYTKRLLVGVPVVIIIAAVLLFG